MKKIKVIEIINKKTNKNMFLINPTDNWRKQDKIKKGELKEELLTLEEILNRYELTEKEILTLKNNMKP